MTLLFEFFKNFYCLTKEAEMSVQEISKVISLKKNDELQPMGHTCKTVYFINKGIARIHYFKDGNDITESFAFKNQVIARIESLFTGKPSRKAIQILEDAEIVAIDATKLFKLYDKYPEIERLFKKIFERSYVDLVNRIEGIQFHSAEERYKALINDAPEVLKKIPLKYIASYLGITQVSLSRIRALR
jgi:CRP-like cAMP-binding protein